MSRGYFITFEGLDGSGKSTQLRLLKEWLELNGEKVVATRQPGGTALGDRIRTLLLDSRSENISPMAELGLMFSDRAQSIAEVIAPALSAGQTVLCDRFTDSTEAYQGGGRQLGSKIVLDLHKSICGGLNPDLTLLLLPDLDLSLGRARRRNERHAAPSGADENRFERENREFYMRVQSKYREIAARDAQRVVLLEGNATVREIHLKVADILQHRFRSDGAWKHAQEIS